MQYLKLTVILSIMLAGFSLNGQKAFDPYLSNLGFDTKPYSSLGQQGTYSFIFGNLGLCQMPLNRDTLTMTIRLSKDTVLPATGIPLNDLSGEYVPYFNWSYDTSSNSFTGVQSVNIPDVNFTSGNIINGAGIIEVHVIYAIGTPSSMNFGQGGNGVFVSLNVPDYALGLSNPAIPDCSNTQTGGNTANDNVRAFNFLPINVSTFSVKKNSEQVVQLNWTTLSERNSLEFEIQRSTADGVKDWQTINKVAAAGQSSREIQYTYADKDLPRADKLYYRIKLVDVEGGSRFTEVRSVLHQWSSLESEVYPNPTRNQFSLKFQSNQEGQVTMELTDILGRIMTRDIMDHRAGTSIRTFDLENCPAGTYVLKVSNPVSTQSLTILKSN